MVVTFPPGFLVIVLVSLIFALTLLIACEYSGVFVFFRLALTETGIGKRFNPFFPPFGPLAGGPSGSRNPPFPSDTPLLGWMALFVVSSSLKLSTADL